MSFLLTATDTYTMPYVVEINEDTLEQALTATASIKEGRLGFRPQFLINLETGEAQRVVEWEGQFRLSDKAYQQNIGVDTGPAWLLDIDMEAEETAQEGEQ